MFQFRTVAFISEDSDVTLDQSDSIKVFCSHPLKNSNELNFVQFKILSRLKEPSSGVSVSLHSHIILSLIQILQFQNSKHTIKQQYFFDENLIQCKFKNIYWWKNKSVFFVSCSSNCWKPSHHTGVQRYICYCEWIEYFSELKKCSPSFFHSYNLQFSKLQRKL